MIRIQHLPWLRALPLLIVCSIVLGFATQGIAGAIVDLDHRLLTGALGALGGFLALAGGISLAYRPFAIDPASGRARVGGREVAIASFTEATRSISAGSNGAAYLTYRFRSTEGPSVRVLIAGRPLPGLDPAGMQALARFLELAPIPGPATPDAGHDAVASTILADGKKVPVSAAALLAELGEAGASVDAAATTSAVVGTPVAPAATPEPLDEAALGAMQADDLAAVESLRPTVALGIARRVAGLALGLVVVGIVVAAVALLIAAAVGVDIEGPGTGTGVGVALGLLALTGLAWSILGDVHTRAVRAVGLRWVETADAATTARGIPSPFHDAWLTFAPGHRVLTILAFTAGVLGLLGVIGGPVAMSMGEVGIGAGALAVGLGLSGFAIWFWIRHRRRRRTDVTWILAAAGPRGPGATPPPPVE